MQRLTFAVAPSAIEQQIALLKGSYNKRFTEIIQYNDHQHNCTRICDCHCAAKTANVNATQFKLILLKATVAFTSAVFAAQ